MQKTKYGKNYILRDTALELWRMGWTNAEIAKHFGVRVDSVNAFMVRNHVTPNIVPEESEKIKSEKLSKLNRESIECKAAGLTYGVFHGMDRYDQIRAMHESALKKKRIDPSCVVCTHEKCDPDTEPCVSCKLHSKTNRVVNFEYAYGVRK